MTMAAARDVVHALADAGLTVATGESLTAGLVAARLADVPGASAVLHGGVVAYQNAVKTGLLGVPADLLARVGAVDADVARTARAQLAEALHEALGPDWHAPEPSPDTDDRLLALAAERAAAANACEALAARFPEKG